jgi:hypothetical protein
MSNTAQSIINDALLTIGVLADGETPSVNASNIGLYALNNLLASWDLERLSVYSISESKYTLVNGTQQYTIGQEGSPTFNAPRPVSIRSASIISSQGHVFPLKLIPSEEFNSIPERSAEGLIPRVLYNDYAYPNSTLWLYPIPSGAVTLDLFTWDPLGSFALLTTAFDMPPGYQRALILNLAVELCPKFQRPLDQTLAAIAGQSKNAISGVNAPPVPGAAQEMQAEMLASGPPR